MHVLQFCFFFTWVCGINKHRSYDYGACWKDSVVVSVISQQQWTPNRTHHRKKKRLSSKSLLILVQKDLPLCPIVIQTAKAYTRQAACLDTDKITLLLCKRRMGKQTGSSQSSSSSNSKWWNIVISTAPLRAEGRWRRRSWRWRRKGRRRKHLNKWQVLGEICLLYTEPSACFLFFFLLCMR